MSFASLWVTRHCIVWTEMYKEKTPACSVMYAVDEKLYQNVFTNRDSGSVWKNILNISTQTVCKYFRFQGAKSEAAMCLDAWRGNSYFITLPVTAGQHTVSQYLHRSTKHKGKGCVIWKACEHLSRQLAISLGIKGWGKLLSFPLLHRHQHRFFFSNSRYKDTL